VARHVRGRDRDRAAFAPSWSASFFFDDKPGIEENRSIRRLWPLTDVLAPSPTVAGATGRRVVILSLAINYALGGLDSHGCHAANLALHAGAAGRHRRRARSPRT
jgi:hypothetical protein